jgi:aryl-alcohol dehydrogenase-like predicted oxidoreductase
MSEIELTLKRLQTDYLDLYIIHRWDEFTPIEETMEALHDLVKAGKVRYIGASSMYAWQFAKAQHVAKERGWTQFVSMQNKYNLFYREEEREMIPLLQDQKVAMTPYQPLAGGRLARFRDEQTVRAESQAANKSSTTLYSDDCENEINNRVEELAKKHNVGKSIISMSWIFSKSFITSALIGSSKTQQLDDAVLALDFKLSNEEIKYLEDTYIPHFLRF